MQPTPYPLTALLFSEGEHPGPSPAPPEPGFSKSLTPKPSLQNAPSVKVTWGHELNTFRL